MSQDYNKRGFPPRNHYPSPPNFQPYPPPNFYPPSYPSYPAINTLNTHTYQQNKTPSSSSGSTSLLFLVPFALLIIAIVLYMLCQGAALKKEKSQHRKRRAPQTERKKVDQSNRDLSFSSSSSEEGLHFSEQQQLSINPEFTPSAPPLLESPAGDLPPTYEEVSLPITTESCTESTAECNQSSTQNDEQ